MGGGVIGTAAKAALSGAFRSPIFGAASRGAGRKQVSSFAPAVEPELFVSSLSAGHERTEVSAVAVASHWPEFEFEEWEITGGKDENVESVNVVPRRIFGPVPTMEEAEEATTDLKDALEKVYFTPQHTLASNYKVCQEMDSGECSSVSSVPNHVVQMHSLLQTREAQEIVVSLASDKNVWNSVMNNPKVVQFCKNPLPAFAEIHKEPAEFVAEQKLTDEFSPTVEEKGTFWNFLTKKKPTVEANETSGDSYLRTMKLKVLQMVSGITNFIKDFFGTSTVDASSLNDKSAGSATDNTNTVLGASVFAAVVGAILIIVLKRL